jgi:DNA-binding response OmpR family regulator
MTVPEPVANEAKRVLVVEDDPAIHGAIELLLRHYGFEVTVAPTLKTAKARYQQQHDLILLDLALPDGNGLDLLQQIRFSGKDARVFVLTGNTHSEVERKIRRLVPDQHFQKPFNFLEILECIRREFPEVSDDSDQFRLQLQ